MPELPEVQTIVQGLEPLIVGQTISELDVLLPKAVWFDDVRATGDQEVNQVKTLLEGQKIISITRRGKLIIIHVSGEVTILIHLKMTGQLIYDSPSNKRLAGGHPTADMVKDLPTKSTRVIFHLANKGTLYFNDQRQFGYVKVIPTQSLPEHSFYKSFGPEPLESTFNEQYMCSLVSNKTRLKIKQILLDQSLIAGIGNIYADESLFQAGINPAKLAGQLNQGQIQNLVVAIKDVLQKGLEYGGTSSQHYVQANGQQGTMQDHLMVYRRTDQPCYICGTAIQRIVVAGRGTHFCPQCQPLEK